MTFYFTMFLYLTIWDFISPNMISYLTILTIYFTIWLHILKLQLYISQYDFISHNYAFIFCNITSYLTIITSYFTMKWYTYTIAYSIYHNYDYISQSAFIFNSLAAFITIMTLYLAFETSYLITPTLFLTAVELWLHIPQMCLNPGSLESNSQEHFTFPRPRNRWMDT